MIDDDELNLRDSHLSLETLLDVSLFTKNQKKKKKKKSTIVMFRSILTIVAVFCNLVTSSSAAYTYTWQTNVPQRMQWDNNYGYCGGIIL